MASVNSVGADAWTEARGVPEAPQAGAPPQQPQGDDALDVGSLGVWWVSADPNGKFWGNDRRMDSCAGTYAFTVVWSGPEDDLNAEEWAAHIAPSGGASTVGAGGRRRRPRRARPRSHAASRAPPPPPGLGFGRGEQPLHREFIERTAGEGFMQRLAHPLGAVLVGAAQQPRQRASGLMAPAFGLEQSPQPSEGLAQLRGQFRGHLPHRLPHRLRLAREFPEVVAVAHPPAAESLPRVGVTV